MPLASPEKIETYRARGWWGEDTLYDVFVRAAAHRPEAIALIDAPDRASFSGGSARRMTWAEVVSETEAVATALDELGYKKGDRLMTVLPNLTEVMAVYLACAKLGVVLSPLPVQSGAHELRSVAAAVEPRGVLAATRFKETQLAEAAGQALGSGVQLLALGAGVSDGAIDFQAAIRDAASKPPTPRAGTADDTFTICWTSGTTGVPKGVPRSHNHWLAIAPATFDGMGLRPEDEVLLNPFPIVNMAAIGGMMCSWLLSRGSMVLHHPFELPVFLQQLVAEKVTATVAPPALLTVLLKKPEVLDRLDLGELRVIGSGSAPLSTFMVQGWKDRGVEVVNLFGSNEGVSLVTGPADAPEAEARATRFPRFGHRGAAFDNRMHGQVELSLRSAGVEIEEPGVTGELWVRGPAVFEGYWRSTEAEQAEVFDANGFFRTGDLFQIAPDDEHFLLFRGRTKDIIIRGGVNVSAVELDTLLDSHPLLTEAAVFPVPDEVLGERIGVAVVPKPEAEVDLEAICAHLIEAGLAKNKLPEVMVPLASLPRNPMNKLLRWKLEVPK